MRTSLQATLLAMALALASSHASAQDFSFGWNPRSGDVWVDTWLGDMNRYGSRYRDPFIDEMVRYHGAPRDLVEELLIRRRWAPGDIYFACALARIAGHPCRHVVDMWERDHGQGRGSIAKRMGIKPGSAEFHRLKRGMVPSYDRWGRPIELDRDLEDDFPGRGKGKSKSKGDDHGNHAKHDRNDHHDDHSQHGPGHGKGKSESKGKGKGKGKD